MDDILKTDDKYSTYLQRLELMAVSGDSRVTHFILSLWKNVRFSNHFHHISIELVVFFF